MEKTRIPRCALVRGPDGSRHVWWTERGLEPAEFLLSPNPGEELRPLARIASGGELSRILLALQVRGQRWRRRGRHSSSTRWTRASAAAWPRSWGASCARSRSVTRSSASRTCRRSRRMADRALRGAQARGRGPHAHRGATRSTRPERVEEVARMLGGETITATSRKHAREMVKHAQAKPRVKAGHDGTAEAAFSSRRSAAR